MSPTTKGLHPNHYFKPQQLIMKDLSGTYRHERFHQLWEIEKANENYIIHAFTLSDERQKLGTPMSTIGEYLTELIRNKDLTLVQEKKSSIRKLMEKFW